jgi:hypothetical protein
LRIPIWIIIIHLRRKGCTIGRWSIHPILWILVSVVRNLDLWAIINSRGNLMVLYSGKKIPDKHWKFDFWGPSFDTFAIFWAFLLQYYWGSRGYRWDWCYWLYEIYNTWWNIVDRIIDLLISIRMIRFRGILIMRIHIFL